MPSGNDSAAAQAVFDHLYSQYLASIPLDRTQILWTGPFYVALYGIALMVFFYLLTSHLRHAGLHGNRLLELTSFGGHLSERVGELAIFSYIVWVAIALWAGYFAVKQMLFGLIY